MKNDAANSIAKPSRLKSVWEAFERFFFAPKDPTVLGLMRILCGSVALYTVLAYSFSLDDLIAKNAWWGLEDRLHELRNRIYITKPLYGVGNPPRGPSTPLEESYWKSYRKKWLRRPPPPYPVNQEQVDFADKFILQYGYDFRMNGIAFPSSKKEEAYLLEFVQKFNIAPSRYPKTEADAEETMAFVAKYGLEPNQVYTRGSPEWSIWFHLPSEWIVPTHIAICLFTFLFTIGFCTRATAVLTWLGQMSYIHRAPQALFGVDAMMVIVLFYLMIGASGAALSVDRLIANWRRKKRGLPALPAKPEPSVSAGFVLRLFQIHLCIIYCAAGLSKLQGRSWWNGTAVWGTLANWEFAPMQYDIYLNFLWAIGSVGWVYHLFMTTAGYFTLVFEIGYPCLIWNRYTRWFILGMAVILHGFIGLFMGLKTFALMMLFMNMAFLRPSEAYWMLRMIGVGEANDTDDAGKTQKPATSRKPRKKPKVGSVASSIQEKRAGS